MVSAYIHDWNPVLMELIGPLALRWYGLAYLVSFLLGFVLLKHLAEKKLWVLPASEVSDFIALSAMFGVFLGGRLGYVLFYMIPDRGINEVIRDPLSIIRVWDGGMASHGGILALVVFTFIYAKKKGVSWTGLGDGLCVVAPVGIFCVRMANFINGELYGRITEKFKYAVKFPNALFDGRAPESENYTAALIAVQEHTTISPESRPSPDWLKELLRTHEELHPVMENFLFPRHPSQLYEGLIEGLLLFLFLWGLRLSNTKLGHGVLTGLFFIIYAGGRIFCEQYREPDSAMVGIFTKGQFYSLFMLLLGGAFLIWGMTRGKKAVDTSS